MNLKWRNKKNLTVNQDCVSNDGSYLSLQRPQRNGLHHCPTNSRVCYFFQLLRATCSNSQPLPNRRGVPPCRHSGSIYYHYSVRSSSYDDSIHLGIYRRKGPFLRRGDRTNKL